MLRNVTNAEISYLILNYVGVPANLFRASVIINKVTPLPEGFIIKLCSFITEESSESDAEMVAEIIETALDRLNI
jgi:hypothetical protein